MPTDEQAEGRPTALRAVFGRLDWHSRRLRIGLAGTAVVLVALAAILIVVGLRGQVRAPRPPAAAATPLTTSQPPPPSEAPPSPGKKAANPLPLRLEIPAIKVKSTLSRLGRNRDGTVQVPPLDDVAQAGWYRYSPVPGDTGPAIILGHIDSARAGKGVFFDLGALRPRDIVIVRRADHRLETFTVSRVLERSKKAFPAQEVYGNTVDPELRLITCGGKFDAAARSYEDNIIVFATLTSTRTT